MTFFEIEYQQLIYMDQCNGIRCSLRSANYINCIGLFQVQKADKVVQYGLGVIFQRGQSLVTLSKYFENSQRPGRIFFRKQKSPKQPVRFPQIFDISQCMLHEYDIYRSASVKRIGFNHLFASIKIQGKSELKDRMDNKFHMIDWKNIKDGNFCRGLAIGLMKKTKEQTIFAQEFIIDSIGNLQLPFKIGLAYSLCEKSEVQQEESLDYFYGFYENPQQGEKGKILQFCRPKLRLRGGTKKCFPNNYLNEVKGNEYAFPYNSIEILANKDAFGTVQFLYDIQKKNCKFLITCAHNFQQQIDKNIFKIDQVGYLSQQLSEVKLLVKVPIPNQPEYMETIELNKFHIRKVYIPRQYVLGSGNQKTLFKCQQMKQIVRISRASFFDIAIIELKQPINIQLGFRIKSKEKSYQNICIQNIEIAGFPRSSTLMNTVHMNMYKESIKDHNQTYFQIGQSIKDKKLRIVKHKLSTLEGSSGSPIYELSKNGQCYLIGIHTKGEPANNSDYGKYNLATYLYSDPIYKWMMGIPDIDSVIDKCE